MMDRNCLDRIQGLMATVGPAMRSVCAGLAGLSDAAGFREQNEARLVEAKLPEVSAAMQEAFSYIADGWADIKDNEVRMYEVFLFVQEYRKFREAVVSFDDIFGRSEVAPEVFEDILIANEYFLLVSKYDRLLGPVLSETSDRYSPDAGSRYTGMADALRSYIRRAEDSVLEGIVTGKAAPERKLRWVGPLNEATLFGQHFKLSCKWMNECFAFRGKDGRTVSLNYTHNRLNNDIKTYPIFDILVKFPAAR